MTKKALVIAEKPELGRAIAQAMIQGPYQEKDGMIDSNLYCIIWAYGHILTLAEPEDYDEKYSNRNDVSLLPIYFDNWKRCKPKDQKVGGKTIDNSYKRNRLKQIGKLLRQYDTVIHCGDPDEEGQLLIDEILDYFHYQGKVFRVLINDNLPENIRKQFDQIQENENFRSMGRSAYARQMADKCFGINHSRLASIRYRKPLVIGRVISPTLNLVVQRDEAISNHVVQKYYELEAECSVQNRNITCKFQPSKELLQENKEIYERNILEEIKKECEGKPNRCIQFTSKQKEERPPLPYNATELQADMNGRYGYSLSETMTITQSLREKHKAITYNRSDCQYLKMEHFQEAPTVLPTIMKNLNKQYPVRYDTPSKCFDDTKISAHHGIIPQNKEIDINQMNTKERNVYIAICERYIMQFLDPVKRNVCQGVIELDQGILKYSSSYIVDAGYRKFFQTQEQAEEEKKPFFSDGRYEAKILATKILEKDSKPLPYYTPKTLVKDMCGISKYVEDPYLKKALKEKDKEKEGENGSIGTVATRGAIVDNLFRLGYIQMKGKSIVSTTLGKQFCSLLPNDVKSPEMTARWWLMQEDIKNGKENINAVMHQVVKEFQKHKDTDYQNKNVTLESETKESFGKCPICGKNIVKNEKKKTYYCSGYQEGCSFTLFEDFKRFNDKIHLTGNKVRTLLSGKTITETLTAKSGKSYKAKLKLNIQESNGKSYPSLDFVEFVNTKKHK